MNQIAEATRPGPPGSGSGSDPETSNRICSLSRQTDSRFQGAVRSDPFGDLDRISRITDVSVDDLNRIEMSTYHEETTDGGL
jgi:hypothetical protein